MVSKTRKPVAATTIGAASAVVDLSKQGKELTSECTWLTLSYQLHFHLVQKRGQTRERGEKDRGRGRREREREREREK